MRDFFINAFEKMVGVIIVLGAIAVVLGAVGALASGESGAVLLALGVLVGGSLYLIFMGGIMNLGSVSIRIRAAPPTRWSAPPVTRRSPLRHP